MQSAHKTQINEGKSQLLCNSLLIVTYIKSCDRLLLRPDSCSRSHDRLSRPALECLFTTGCHDSRLSMESAVLATLSADPQVSPSIKSRDRPRLSMKENTTQSTSWGLEYTVTGVSFAFQHACGLLTKHCTALLCARYTSRIAGANAALHNTQPSNKR